MAIANADRTDQRPPVGSLLGRRLAGFGWLLAVAAVLLLCAALAGAMAPFAAVLVFAGLFAAACVVPLPARPAADLPMARLDPPPAPDNGISRLAEALPDPCFILDRRGI